MWPSIPNRRTHVHARYDPCAIKLCQNLQGEIFQSFKDGSIYIHVSILLQFQVLHEWWPLSMKPPLNLQPHLVPHTLMMLRTSPTPIQHSRRSSISQNVYIPRSILCSGGVSFVKIHTATSYCSASSDREYCKKLKLMPSRSI